MKKIRLKPIDVKDYEQFANGVLARLYTAPQHLLINSLMGLGTSLIELATHETDIATRTIAILSTVDEALKANENEPEYFPTCLRPDGEIAEGEA